MLQNNLTVIKYLSNYGAFFLLDGKFDFMHLNK